MIITDVMIKDFLSFKEAHFQFPRSGLVLLSGWNEDQQRSNGAGKSSLFNALCWCIYGELPKEIKVEELIRRGEKSCAVAVRFEVDGIRYGVVRKRPSGLEITINGEKQKGNPKFLQAFIESTIGLNYKQFLITSFFPQKGDASRFIKQNDATAKDFLSTILNFNKTEQAYKKIHMEMKDLDVLIGTKSGEVASIENSITRFESLINMPIPEMPDRAQVVAVKKELDLLAAQTLTEPDTTQLDAQILQVQSGVNTVNALKHQTGAWGGSISEKTLRINHLKNSDAHTLTCPSCSAELLESAGQLVEFDHATAEQIKADKISALSAEIEVLQAKIDKAKPVIEKAAEFDKKLEDLKVKRRSLRHDYDMSLQRQFFLKDQIQSFKKAIVSSQQVQRQRDEIVTQLEEMREQLAIKTAELQNLQGDLILAAASKVVLSPTGAIAYSLDGIMSDLNEQVSQYLDIFSHNTMVYNVTSGDDKAKVTHTLSKDGADVSVGSLSGGEERGLILSVDLGLAEVIVTRSGVNLPSVLMLDECFEGLDYVGKEQVIDALREIATDRCIIVIDHSTEFNALFDQSMRVVKKNGISSLEIL